MEVTDPDLHRFDDIDDTSAQLILQLQHEDLDHLLNTRKGKSRDGELSDADLAMAIYQEELSTTNTILRDRSMTRSLAQAVISDGALLTEALADEEAAARDRAFAHHVAGRNAPLPAGGTAVQQLTLDDEILKRMAALYVYGGSGEARIPENTAQDDDEPAAESSAWAASRQKPSMSIHQVCVSCDSTAMAQKMCRAACGHLYCQECLCALFDLATTDETLFPPRCCRENIPLTLAEQYLGWDLVRKFERKSVEFSTSDRTYCFQPTCSSFIDPSTIVGDRAACTNCGNSTCTICKSNAHDGDCPYDDATQILLDVASQLEWRRCYNCRRVIELDVGCNHMTYAPLRFRVDRPC